MQLKIKQIAGLYTALKTPFSFSDTMPENPVEGQVWFDTTSATIYIYIQDTNGPVWVEVS